MAAIASVYCEQQQQQQYGASSGCGWRTGLLDVKLAANTRDAFSIMAVKCSPSPWEMGKRLKISHRKIGNVKKFYTRI